MSDLNLPPEEPMPQDRKSRLRRELLAAAETEPARRHTHPWLVPALAAAAVVGVVATGVVLGGADDPDPGGTTVEPAAPPSTTPEPEPEPPASTAPTDAVGSSVDLEPSEPPDARGSGATSLPVPPNTGPEQSEDPASCDDEVAAFAGLEPSLRGAKVTAERAYGSARTLLYETKEAWVVCDEFSAVDGGFPTLLNFHRKSAGYEPDRSTLAVSTNYVESEGGLLSEYVAGGRDFDGVAAISFAFPDGHTERAIVGQNGLWSMVYLPERDLSAQGPPIEVTVEYTDAVGGGSETFVLRWGLDTCAQLNHGC